MKATKRLLTATLSVAACLTFGAAPARADEFRVEKKTALALGKAAVETARPLSEDATMLSYDIERPKTNRMAVTIKMEWYGVPSGKRYTSTVVCHIDTSNPIEILKIDYSDTWGNSLTDMSRLVRKLNKALRDDN